VVPRYSVIHADRGFNVPSRYGMLLGLMWE
jgi:hypothetical protein